MVHAATRRHRQGTPFAPPFARGGTGQPPVQDGASSARSEQAAKPVKRTRTAPAEGGQLEAHAVMTVCVFAPGEPIIPSGTRRRLSSSACFPPFSIRLVLCVVAVKRHAMDTQWHGTPVVPAVHHATTPSPERSPARAWWCVMCHVARVVHDGALVLRAHSSFHACCNAMFLVVLSRCRLVYLQVLSPGCLFLNPGAPA